MQVLLIRHALPVRIEGADGPADPPLSPTGMRQAEALAHWLADDRLDALYVSPMNRARQTAAPLEERTGHSAIVVDGVAEFDRHANDYVPIEELRGTDDPRWLDMVEGRYFTEGPISPEDFQAEVIESIDGIIRENPGRTVAVVCHGGVINAYLASILGIETPIFFEPTYTGISRFMASRSGHRTLVSVNETAHLRSLV